MNAACWVKKLLKIDYGPRLRTVQLIEANFYDSAVKLAQVLLSIIVGWGVGLHPATAKTVYYRERKRRCMELHGPHPGRVSQEASGKTFNLIVKNITGEVML